MYKGELAECYLRREDSCLQGCVLLKGEKRELSETSNTSRTQKLSLSFRANENHKVSVLK